MASTSVVLHDRDENTLFLTMDTKFINCFLYNKDNKICLRKSRHGDSGIF